MSYQTDLLPIMFKSFMSDIQADLNHFCSVTFSNDKLREIDENWMTFFDKYIKYTGNEFQASLPNKNNVYSSYILLEILKLGKR